MKLSRHRIEGSVALLAALILSLGLGMLLYDPGRERSSSESAQVAADDPRARPALDPLRSDRQREDERTIRDPAPTASVAPVGSAPTPRGSDPTVLRPEEPTLAPGKRQAKLTQVEGSVQLPNGAPAVNAVVVFGDRRWGKKLRTDGAGRFAGEVREGRYRLSAKLEGYADSQSQRVRLRANRKREFSEPLVLRAALSFSGVVVDPEGEAIEGAVVSAQGEGDAKTQTDAEGAFVLAGLPEGLYRLRARAKGYVSWRRERVPLAAEGAALEIKLERAGGLRGSLTGGDGAPLKGGYVFVYRDGKRLASARSNDLGLFDAGDVAPGPVELFARSDDYAWTTRSQTTIKEGATGSLDLALATGPTIKGQLVDDQGEPLAGVSVRVRNTRGDVRRKGLSNAEGAYEVRNLYPGLYLLEVAYGSRGTPLLTQEVEVIAGEHPLNLRVPSTVKISGRVLDARGEPLAKVGVFAIAGKAYRATTQSGAEGRYELSRFPAGEYRIYVRVGNNRLVGFRDVTLSRGQTLADFDIVARAPAALRGRVLDPEGNPVVGLRVDLRGLESPVRRKATTNAEGRYELAPLYDGRYRVTLNPASLALIAERRGQTGLSAAPQTVTVELGRDLARDFNLLAPKPPQ